MRNFVLLVIISGFFIASACKKDDEMSQRFEYLTGHIWTSDSLLANGIDQSDGLLMDFKGDAKFNKDGTGYFGTYQGTWKFAYNETELVISSSSLPIPSITTQIVELNENSLKITTGFPNLANPGQPLAIRLTFKAK